MMTLSGIDRRSGEIRFIYRLDLSPPPFCRNGDGPWEERATHDRGDTYMYILRT